MPWGTGLHPARVPAIERRLKFSSIMVPTIRRWSDWMCNVELWEKTENMWNDQNLENMDEIMKVNAAMCLKSKKNCINHFSYWGPSKLRHGQWGCRLLDTQGTRTSGTTGMPMYSRLSGVNHTSPNGRMTPPAITWRPWLGGAFTWHGSSVLNSGSVSMIP